MSSILDFRGLFFVRLNLTSGNNLRRISTMYVRGYLQGSENGRVVTIGDISGTIFFRADRSLGAKQEGPTIVHF
jgi:hypothetical protein